MLMNTLEILQKNYPGSVFLNLTQSALALSITTQTLRVGISKKTIQLKTVKQGGRRLVHMSELARYIDGLAASATGPKKRGRPRNVVSIGGEL